MTTRDKQPTEKEKLAWQLDLLDQFKEFLKFKSLNPDLFFVTEDKEDEETVSIEISEERINYERKR
jgi:hypothetical protein